MSNGEIVSFYPRNDQGWYQGNANTGSLSENRAATRIYTLDYLGRVTREITPDLGANFSFGSQVIAETYDRITGSGVGFVTNANRVVGSATEISASQTFSQDRSVGLLGQVDLDYKDKLFVQGGGRLDQNSSFGGNAKPFFLPRDGRDDDVAQLLERQLGSQLLGHRPVVRTFPGAALGNGRGLPGL